MKGGKHTVNRQSFYCVMKAILCFAFISLLVLSIAPHAVEMRRINNTPFKWSNRLPSQWKKREFTNEHHNKLDTGFQRSDELSRLDKVEGNTFGPPQFPRPGKRQIHLA